MEDVYRGSINSNMAHMRPGLILPTKVEDDVITPWCHFFFTCCLRPLAVGVESSSDVDSSSTLLAGVAVVVSLGGF